MRSLTALALYVSLAAASPAADWQALHKEGVEAVRRHDFSTAAKLFRDSAPLAQNPVQQALSANDLGVTLHQLHRDPEARQHLENAFRIWQSNPGQEIRLAETTEALASVYRTLGDYPSAEQALREAMKTPPSEPNSRALMLNELGDILREVGRPIEAYKLLETAVNLPGISVRRRLDSMLGLADLDRDAHRWDSSFARWKVAVDTAREQHWPALEAASLRGLGTTYLEHGEFARAEPLLRRALTEFEASDAPVHQVSSTLSCLAQLYLSQNKLAMAEDVLHRGLDLAEKSLGPQHPQVAVLLEMLGNTVANRNQLALARDYYQRAHLIMAGRFGEQSPIAAAVDASWALIEQHLNHNAEAAADYEKALVVLDAAGPDVEPLRANVHQHYAEVCKALHRKSPAPVQSFRTLSTGGQMPQSH